MRTINHHKHCKQSLVFHSEPLFRLHIWYYTLHVHLMNILLLILVIYFVSMSFNKITQYTLDPGFVNWYCCNPVFLFIVFGENKLNWTELNWSSRFLTLANSLKVSIISFVATSLCMGAPQFFIHASSTLEWQTNMRRWSNHNNNAGNFICNKQCLSTEEFEPSFSKQWKT